MSNAKRRIKPLRKKRNGNGHGTNAAYHARKASMDGVKHRGGNVPGSIRRQREREALQETNNQQ